MFLLVSSSSVINEDEISFYLTRASSLTNFYLISDSSESFSFSVINSTYSEIRPPVDIIYAINLRQTIVQTSDKDVGYEE